MIKSWLVVGGFALGTVACGADDSGGLSPRSYAPVPGCEHVPSAPCDTMETSCQEQRLELAACLRGSEPGTLPPVTRLSEQEFAASIDAVFAQEPRPNPDHFERALVLLHLLQPGALAPAPMTMDLVARIWGFYDWETDNITLVDHGSPKGDARSNVILLHELVHALQDRDVDLQAYASEHGTSYDAALASRAIFEGEAQWHEDRYAASLHGLDPGNVDWHQTFEDRIALGDQWVLAQPSPYLATSTVFPYDYGERLLDFAWQAGGHQAVLALFAAPPASTQVLMASVDAPSEPTPPVDLVAPTAPEGWTLPGNDVLGAWGLFLTLTRGADPQAMRAAALAWRGDLFSVYAGPSQPAETALVWQLELADEASAGTVAANLTVLVGSPPVRRQGTRVTVAVANTTVSLPWAFGTP